MEDHIALLLASTQLADQQQRVQAEQELNLAKTNPAFPTALVNIASHSSITTAIRQGALTALRHFVQVNWAEGGDGLDSEPIISISDDIREQLKRALLGIALSADEDRKIKTAASYVIGKIATEDFPEKWRGLLPTVLGVISSGSDNQVHGALKVLGDIVRETLSEDQFFTMAPDIMRVVTEIGLNETRKPSLRSLAILVFRACFDLMDFVKIDHKDEVRSFAEESLRNWSPFFMQVLNTRLSDSPIVDECQPPQWNDLISLKLQSVKTLLKIRQVFPDLLLPQSTTLFTAIWQELSSLETAHAILFVDGSAQGRLEDIDSMPYTLDFLVLEELDFLSQCFRAKPVQAELAAQSSAQVSPQEPHWMVDIMKLLISYSRITSDEEGLWDVDCSLYLAEETSVSANYTARTAAGDLLIKMGEWFDQKTVDVIFECSKQLFADPSTTWRHLEAALYLFSMLMGDFHDTKRDIPGHVASAYLEMVEIAISRTDNPLLKARGFLVGGCLSKFRETPPTLLDRAIGEIPGNSEEPDEVVQVACIRAVGDFVNSGQARADRQVPIFVAISQYIGTKDQTEMEEADELLVTLEETLRAAIKIDVKIALVAEVQSIELLFLVAKLGSSNFQVTSIASEAFEDILKGLPGRASYAALCSKVLPILTGALDVGNIAKATPFLSIATELLVVLVQYGSEPLPAGFVAATFPILSRLLMECDEGDDLRPGAEAVKYILMHDHHQVFGWHDVNGRSGLEVCLHIIDRLLGPSIEDNSASEVGGLAAELVEKAGQERLGPFLPQLLQAVANRVATAQASNFIQSLISVFARLSLVGAEDVVEFLSQCQIGGSNGLQVVLSKWLENSVSFAGYDEIRQNVIALSKLYSLNSPRLSQTMVKGDLIINDNDAIKTRSRARMNPDQYTIIPATLKILKVLIEELSSASGYLDAATMGSNAAMLAAELREDENDDDGWEDEHDTLDLSLGSTKADLMTLLESTTSRQRDDETQAYLTEFFLRAAQENVANFQELFSMLTDEEKAKLQRLASSVH